MEASTQARGPYPASGLGWPTGTPATGTPERAPDAGNDGVSLESGLGFRLGRAHRTFREVWEKTIADLGVSPPQAALLRAVAERPDSGLRELARRMRTDAMNAKRLADHLEQAGLMRSVSDPGHRQRRALRPTEEGAALAAELGRRAAAHEQRLSALVGARELALLQALLTRLESALTAGPTGKDGDLAS